MARRAISRGWPLAALLLALWVCTPGAVGDLDKNKNRERKPPRTGFIYPTYTDPEGQQFKYAAFVPHSFKPGEDTKYPVILFMHGRHLEGRDGVKPTTVGLGPAIKDHEDDFEFIVVFPQAIEPWECGSDDCERAVAILDHFTHTSPYGEACDLHKVSVTGLSQGGHATWCLAVAHPERWAAMVVVAGFAACKDDTNDLSEDAEKIKDIPAWFFHGKSDEKVKFRCGVKMFHALQHAGGDPKHTWTPADEYTGEEYPGQGSHNGVWFKDVYENQLDYDWLREQSRE
jgi:predicted peptidase